MAKIIAKRPILLANRIYQPGEILPAWDEAMVSAWLEAESAIIEEASDTAGKTETKDEENTTAENTIANDREEASNTAATSGDKKVKASKGTRRKK